MENSIFSDFLCPPACDSQNESLYNVDKNLNGTFELHCILKFEKKCSFGRFGHIWCTKSKINVSKISFLMQSIKPQIGITELAKRGKEKSQELIDVCLKKIVYCTILSFFRPLSVKLQPKYIMLGTQTSQFPYYSYKSQSIAMNHFNSICYYLLYYICQYNVHNS